MLRFTPAPAAQAPAYRYLDVVAAVFIYNTDFNPFAVRQRAMTK